MGWKRKIVEERIWEEEKMKIFKKIAKEEKKTMKRKILQEKKIRELIWREETNEKRGEREKDYIGKLKDYVGKWND